jgi:acetyltransferase-like isoleucine patch superfamily enzyme
MARARAARLLRRVADRLQPPAGEAAPAPLTEPHQEVPADPARLQIGIGTFVQPTVHAHPDHPGRVVIGSYAAIGPGCQIWLEPSPDPRAIATSRLTAVAGRTEPARPGSLDVHIGADTWLGLGCRVLAGVRIGEGAVVAAHAVVTEDVRPYAVVAGNPAVEVRRRFPDDVVEALLRIRWWDWTHEEILERGTELCDEDVRAFVERYDQR